MRRDYECRNARFYIVENRLVYAHARTRDTIEVFFTLFVCVVGTSRDIGKEISETNSSHDRVRIHRRRARIAIFHDAAACHRQ